VATEIVMPRFGMTMKQGKLSKWFKREGEPVQKGEALFEVETEKITNTVQSVGSGILARILVKPGTTVPVGTVLGVLSEAGEVLDRIDGPRVSGAAGAEVAQAGGASPAAEHAGPSERGYVPASPAAKRLAKELGVDLPMVRGTGKDGRVTEEDVRRHHEAGPLPSRITPLAAEMARQAGLDVSSLSGTGEGGRITREDIERALAAEPGAGVPGEEAFPALQFIPLDGMRRAIAVNMQASLQNSAQLTLFSEVDVTETARFREVFKAEHAKDDSARISYNDIIVFVAARVLKRFPLLNSALVDDKIFLHDRVDIGVAVALPNGLIVPKLRNADKKGLLEISRETKELARKAREGGLSPDEVVDGTFTVSNLSGLGVDGFTPILNPPETAILGVGRVREKPAVYGGQVVIRSMMTLSLTVDHRVVDGAPAAEFLQSLARHLEHPMLLML